MRETCSQCDNPLVILTELDPQTLYASDHFVQFTREMTAMGIDVVPGEVVVTWCETCRSTSYIGPRISIEGTISHVEGDDT